MNTADNGHHDAGRRLFLLYHELRPARSDYSYAIDCERFEQHVELFVRLRRSADPGLTPEVTFDDGHISNYEYALPILERHRIAGHFFLTVGWVAERAGYMRWDQVRALHAAGQRIGAHGWSHTLLTHCRGEELRRELGVARQVLEEKLGAPVTAMSLPGGRFDRRVLAACEEAGYTEVFTSIPRAERLGAGPLLGRLNIRGDVSVPWLEELFRPDSAALARLERAYRRKEAGKKILGDRLYAKLWAVLNHQEADQPPS